MKILKILFFGTLACVLLQINWIVGYAMIKMFYANKFYWWGITATINILVFVWIATKINDNYLDEYERELERDFEKTTPLDATYRDEQLQGLKDAAQKWKDKND